MDSSRYEKLGYRLTKSRYGITAAILNKNRILLMKRRNIPFTSHPGMWLLLSGSMKRNEKPLETTYREIEEETRIKREELKLPFPGKKVLIVEQKMKGMWYDYFYVLKSSTDRVKLDIENSGYMWIAAKEFAGLESAKAAYGDHAAMAKMIRKALDK
ncbi:MAG: NUDIX domain-containing protein [Candidatus Micrarchaeaceae archaeon]